jgi:DNA-binding transcriptional LysR family regulator
MEYSLRDLRFFETVAELGNIGRAAKALGRSQPAITKCIQRLEQSVGSPLFVRSKRGIALTAVGELLLFQSHQLTTKTAEMARELSDFAHGHGGHVRIGSGLISADQVIADVCSRILSGSGKTTFDIVVAATVSLREELRGGSIDMLLGLAPTADPDFITIPVAEEVLVAAAFRTNPIFRAAQYDLETLLKYPWALPSAALPSRQWLDTAFTSRGFRRPSVFIESNFLPILPRVLVDAELIGFLPRRMIYGDQNPGLREIPVLETTFHRQFGVTYRREGHLSPAAQRVVDLLVAEGESLFHEPVHRV